MLENPIYFTYPDFENQRKPLHTPLKVALVFFVLGIIATGITLPIVLGGSSGLNKIY